MTERGAREMLNFVPRNLAAAHCHRRLPVALVDGCVTAGAFGTRCCRRGDWCQKEKKAHWVDSMVRHGMLNTAGRIAQVEQSGYRTAPRSGSARSRTTRVLGGAQGPQEAAPSREKDRLPNENVEGASAQNPPQLTAETAEDFQTPHSRTAEG